MDMELRIGKYLIYIVPDIGEHVQQSIKIPFISYIIGIERAEYYD